MPLTWLTLQLALPLMALLTPWRCPSFPLRTRDPKRPPRRAKRNSQFMSKTETAINRQKTGTSLNAPHCKPQDSKRSYPKCVIHTLHVSKQMMSFWDIISCKQTFREMFRMRVSKDSTAVWQFYHLLANIVSGRVDRMRPKQVSSVGLNQCGSTSHRGRQEPTPATRHRSLPRYLLDLRFWSKFGQNFFRFFKWNELWSMKLKVA